MTRWSAGDGEPFSPEGVGSYIWPAGVVAEGIRLLHLVGRAATPPLSGAGGHAGSYIYRPAGYPPLSGAGGYIGSYI